MDKKDIIIVDHISWIKQVNGNNTDILEKLNLRVKNLRKYRVKIERRKEKIKRIYG